MQRLKGFRIFLTMAALLFVAKPFFGFKAFGQESKPRIAHTVLVKSFTKRKPESLQDAETGANVMRQLLSGPLPVVSAISLLLLALFPQVLSIAAKITGRTLSDIRLALLPPENSYLRAGKLTI